MAVTLDQAPSIAARIEYLEDRIGYAEFEVQRNLRWERLHKDMAEEKHGKAIQWNEEKARCERERDQLFGSVH